jgi:hypothetical protein
MREPIGGWVAQGDHACTIQRSGQTLDRLSEIMAGCGAKVEVHHAGDHANETTLAAFRARCLAALEGGKEHVLVN